jgi:predicted ATPase
MLDTSNQLPMVRPGYAPLMGRDEPLALLGRLLAACRTGQFTVALLAGAPGIGKTRLLEAFPAPDLAAGVVVLRGGASMSVAMPPYLPFLQALGDYVLAAAPELLREQVGFHHAALATLLPELRARLGPAPPLHPLGPEQERYRLYEAVAGFLAAIAARSPLVLLLDDLHYVDAASCDLLIHLAGRLRSAPLLVVGAFREAEAGDNSAFAWTLAELNRRRLLEVIAVGPLSAEESWALAASLVQGPVAPDVAALLHQHSEGNPFFLEELLRTCAEDGTLIWRTDRWELVEQPARLLPPRIVEAVQQRFTRLDGPVVELLRVAALLGRVFEITLLARVLGQDTEQVELLLLSATRAHLVRPHLDDRYAFTHDLLRETLAADLGSVRRRALHWRRRTPRPPLSGWPTSPITLWPRASPLAGRPTRCAPANRPCAPPPPARRAPTFAPRSSSLAPMRPSMNGS